MTNGKMDGLSYRGNECTVGRPERPGWGQTIMEKMDVITRIYTDLITIINTGFMSDVGLLKCALMHCSISKPL